MGFASTTAMGHGVMVNLWLMGWNFPPTESVDQKHYERLWVKRGYMYIKGLQARHGFKLSLHPHVQFHKVSTET
jgi:hypothetical protein